MRGDENEGKHDQKRKEGSQIRYMESRGEDR